MSKLQTKSQLSECVNILQIYQNIDGKIDEKINELENVIADWQDATSRKLSTTSDVQRALLGGVQNAQISQKQRLEAEIGKLAADRNNIRNDYILRRCESVTGSIG